MYTQKMFSLSLDTGEEKVKSWWKISCAATLVYTAIEDIIQKAPGNLLQFMTLTGNTVLHLLSGWKQAKMKDVTCPKSCNKVHNRIYMNHLKKGISLKGINM